MDGQYDTILSWKRTKKRQSRRGSEKVCMCKMLTERFNPFTFRTNAAEGVCVHPEHRPQPLEVRSSNPELNDLALYKIHDNYTDNYTKPSHQAHGSQLTHTHLPAVTQTGANNC